VSPSRIEQFASCARKDFFRNVLRLAVTRTPWQQKGIDVHRTIERYLLTGEEPAGKEMRTALQVVLPLLPPPPWPHAEVEVRCCMPARAGPPKPNTVVEIPEWCGRKDLAVHMYVDLWPTVDTMDTIDWKVRADTSFRRTPKEDLRDDAQAVMYQLARSWWLTGGWEEPGRHTWVVIDRKRWMREEVFYDYSRGEAEARWEHVLEPVADMMQRVYRGAKPEHLDPADVPDNGFRWREDRECVKWGGCDFTRRCMACGTPVFGTLAGFLEDVRRMDRRRRRHLAKHKRRGP
jgi:hypothetical protein